MWEDLVKDLERVGAKGIIKLKGDCLTLHPNRFSQMKAKFYQPWKVINTPLIGYANLNGFYWLIAKESDEFIRVPFAKNNEWFEALTSDKDWFFIR